MKKITSIAAAILAATLTYGELISLPAPIKWEVTINQITKPVPVLNSNNRWESTVGYDVRDQVVYNEAGSINRVRRLVGEMKLEISAQEVMYLKGLSPTNTYAAGEWEMHVLTAGFMKASVLAVAGEQRSQYETYWNQVIYNPTPVTQPTEDSEGNVILGWEDGLPIIGYDEEETPILGELSKDNQGRDIIGYWNGMPVVGYDSLGFPEFAQ